MSRDIRTARSAGSSQGTGSLKKTMIPSPVKRSERALVRVHVACRRPRGSRRSTAITSSGSLVSANGVKPWKSQNTTTISRRWVASRLLVVDDDVGELRRQEVAQPAGALELGDAVGHPALELGVPRAPARRPARSIVSW